MDINGNKTGGRKKGVSNKLTSELKDTMVNIFESNIKSFETSLANLDDKDKVDAMLKILSFILPKQKEVAIDTNKLTREDLEEDFEVVIHPAHDKIERRPIPTNENLETARSPKIKTRPKREDCTPEQLKEFWDNF